MGEFGMSDENLEIKAPAIDEKQQAAMDGFANFISKVGANAGGNNQLSQSQYVFNLLSRNRIVLEAMYRGSWVIGKIVERVAEDMTRAGITITSDQEPQTIIKMQSSISRLRIWNSFKDMTKWARLYGGAIGVLLIDGQDLSTPLNIDRVGRGQFRGIKVFDRWQITPDLIRIIKDGPDMGLPAYYQLVIGATYSPETQNSVEEMKSSAGYTDGMNIHHSRVIRQTGIDLPYFQQITEMFWGESEIERIYDRLVAFDNATMSAANLINHANLTNVQVDKLREIIASGGKARQALEGMFELMRFMRSNEGITLVDKEDIVNSNQYSFAGLDDILLSFGQQLSGATEIPLIILLGQSPPGFGSTGEIEIKIYYDGINSKQESKYRPGIEKMLKVLHKSEFGTPAPEDMQFEFNSLWKMSDTEKANLGKVITETILGAFAAGLTTRTTSLKELKQHSPQTGLFTNITDEDITESESMEQFDMPPEPNVEETPVDEKKPAKDSAFKKLFQKIKGK